MEGALSTPSKNLWLVGPAMREVLALLEDSPTGRSLPDLHGLILWRSKGAIEQALYRLEKLSLVKRCVVGPAKGRLATVRWFRTVEKVPERPRLGGVSLSGGTGYVRITR